MYYTAGTADTRATQNEFIEHCKQSENDLCSSQSSVAPVNKGEVGKTLGIYTASFFSHRGCFFWNI